MFGFWVGGVGRGGVGWGGGWEWGGMDGWMVLFDLIRYVLVNKDFSYFGTGLAGLNQY